MCGRARSTVPIVCRRSASRFSLPMVYDLSQIQSNAPSFYRGPSWLDLPVCTNFIAGLCFNAPEECLYAHPPPNLDITNGIVRACYSFFKYGVCENAFCKFYHNKDHHKWILECQRKKYILEHGNEGEEVNQTSFLTDLTTKAAVSPVEIKNSSGDTINFVTEQFPTAAPERINLKRRQSQDEYSETKRAHMSYNTPDTSQNNWSMDPDDVHPSFSNYTNRRLN
ncbi:hypothetical protein Aperf_G00000097632 [Anoplocephala perfoliata]